MPLPINLGQDFRLVAAALRELARLDALGLNDSEEADAVRDAMDAPWHRLSPAEETLARGLSGDLYSLTDPPHEVLPMNPQAQDALDRTADLFDAGDAGDAAAALALLRRWNRYVSPAKLAALRNGAWIKLGDPATAILFSRLECRLAPENTQAKLELLHALSLWDQPAALAEAEQIVKAHREHAPSVVAMASAIAGSSSLIWASGDDTDRLTLVEAASFAHFRIPQDSADVDAYFLESLPHMMSALLAFLHNRLGAREEALKWFDLAIAGDPASHELREIRAAVAAGRANGASFPAKLAIPFTARRTPFSQSLLPVAAAV